MKKEYNYYVNIIKPLEKKYNRVSLLYSIFKFKFLKDKKTTYNKFLITYYTMLFNNMTYTKKLEREFKNSHIK